MKINPLLIGKLRNKYIWRRILLERLTEPLHLNIISLFVALFGSWRSKTAFDLIIRQHNAYAILNAAERCRQYGVSKMAICEFGVANGAGFMNMAYIAQNVSRITGVEIRVFGFDSGQGMPTRPLDYRDHPDHYSMGNFKMDVQTLTARLPENAELILGEIRNTIPAFLQKLAKEGYKLGYAVIDVDYYSSTCDALKVFGGEASLYLPLVQVYLDDIGDISHHPSAGELLAVEEFNAQSPLRKIYRFEFLENRRIFRRADWIKHMRCLQVLDHAARTGESHEHKYTVLANPYLSISASR